MTRNTMTQVGTVLAIAVFAIAGCSQATPGASAAPTGAGSSAASAVAPGSSATACQDLTAFKTSVDELRALDLASLVVPMASRPPSPVSSRRPRRSPPPRRQRLDRRSTRWRPRSLRGSKLAVVNLTSEETLVQKKTQIKAAVVGVDQATTALATALTACQ